MNSRNKIQDELVDLDSSLPADIDKPVFDLPESYFENFPSLVLQKIKAEEALSTTDELSRISPLLASVSKKIPYNVPQDYFNNLSENFPAIIREDVLPAMLAAAGKNMPYEVPTGYFESLPELMMRKVVPTEAKVIPMRNTWMRMAAAAAVAGIITIAGFVYFNHQSAVTNDPSLTAQLQGISDKELEDFVNTAEVGGNKIASGNGSADINSMLDDVSTSEMDAFLAQVPTDDKELLIIN